MAGHAPSWCSSRGISLIETLVAALIVATSLAGLAHLLLIGLRQSTSARRDVAALAMAQSQLEELSAQPWSYDATGARVSSPRLSESPPGSLASDVAGFADALDADGRVLTAANLREAAYFRRWAVSRVALSDPDTLLLQVCVVAADHRLVRARVPDACVASIRTRTP